MIVSEEEEIDWQGAYELVRCELILRNKQLAVAKQQLQTERDKVADLTDVIKKAVDACYCHRNKGFDYGEEHPQKGVCPSGRWLSPKELLTMALVDLQAIKR